MTLLDKGGARIREANAKQNRRDRFSRLLPGYPLPSGFPNLDRKRRSIVTVRVAETHNGVECDCIDNGVMILFVGDTLELTHTCHADGGRVDKIVATVLSIESAEVEPEHASVEVNRQGSDSE